MRLRKTDFTKDILRSLIEIDAELERPDLTEAEKGVAEVRRQALMSMLAPCKPLRADLDQRRRA